MTEPLGLIAGSGRLPVLLAKSYPRSPDRPIEAVAFRGDTDPELAALVDRVSWIGVGQLGRLIKIFKRAGVRQAVMAGQIRPTRLFDKVRFDVRGLRLFRRLKDKRADTIFSAVSSELAKEGIALVDSTKFLKDHLPAVGVLSQAQPTPLQKADIEFGQRIAKELGRIDIGQTVVVKNGAVLAVEALEGTNEAIRRGARLGGGEAVVVKMAKPSQDMRFDVPVIGEETIRVMVEAGARCLAIEAGKTLVADLAATLAAADRAGIVLIAV